MTTRFVRLLSRLHEGDSHSVERPIGLKEVVELLCPMFEGEDQQDSHEFLQVLLNGLHDELSVEQPKIAAGDGAGGMEAADSGNAGGQALWKIRDDDPSGLKAIKTWNHWWSSGFSVVTELFYGSYLSPCSLPWLFRICPCLFFDDF